MDACGVRESVLADDGFVALDDEAGVAADELRCLHNLSCVNVNAHVLEVIAARLDRHDGFFEAGVAGALADAVDGAFDLPRAIGDAGEAVGDGETEVVVAMHADDGAIADALGQVPDGSAKLLGHGIADGVGDVHGGRTGLDDGEGDFGEEVQLGARGVFRRELDVGAELAGRV